MKTKKIAYRPKFVRALPLADTRLLFDHGKAIGLLPHRDQKETADVQTPRCASLFCVVHCLSGLPCRFDVRNQAGGISRSRGRSSSLLLNSRRKAKSGLLSAMKPNDESSTPGDSHG